MTESTIAQRMGMAKTQLLAEWAALPTVVEGEEPEKTVNKAGVAAINTHLHQERLLDADVSVSRIEMKREYRPASEYPLGVGTAPYDRIILLAGVTFAEVRLLPNNLREWEEDPYLLLSLGLEEGESEPRVRTIGGISGMILPFWDKPEPQILRDAQQKFCNIATRFKRANSAQLLPIFELSISHLQGRRHAFESRKKFQEELVFDASKGKVIAVPLSAAENREIWYPKPAERTKTPFQLTKEEEDRIEKQYGGEWIIPTHSLISHMESLLNGASPLRPEQVEVFLDNLLERVENNRPSDKPVRTSELNKIKAYWRAKGIYPFED